MNHSGMNARSRHSRQECIFRAPAVTAERSVPRASGKTGGGFFRKIFQPGIDIRLRLWYTIIILDKIIIYQTAFRPPAEEPDQENGKVIAFKANTAAPLQEQIADHLAHRIVSGELPDKSRLPSTVELARLYHVTPVTIHKSLQHLVQRQLIERQPRRGTFVRSRERVNVIALVFGKNPFRDRSHLYSQLLDEFQKQSLERALNLKIYFDFESGSRTMFDLEQDLTSGELKAIIASNRTPKLTEFLEQHPEAAWCEPFHIDQRASVKKGVEYLTGRGYRNIAVVSMMPEELPYPNFREDFRCEQQGAMEGAAGTGAAVRVFRWGQKETDGYEKGKLLLAGENRPDAILVNHDVVCRGLLMAILEQGLRIPRDIAILTHMNHGCEFASPVPLTTLEVDPELMVRGCLDALTAALAGSSPAGIVIPSTVARLTPGKSCGEE